MNKLSVKHPRESWCMWLMITRPGYVEGFRKQCNFFFELKQHWEIVIILSSWHCTPGLIRQSLYNLSRPHRQSLYNCVHVGLIWHSLYNCAHPSFIRQSSYTQSSSSRASMAASTQASHQTELLHLVLIWQGLSRCVNSGLIRQSSCTKSLFGRASTDASTQASSGWAPTARPHQAEPLQLHQLRPDQAKLLHPRLIGQSLYNCANLGLIRQSS